MPAKRWVETSSIFKARIIGKLLGDGGITKQTGRKPRFQFHHVASDLGWSQYCYNQLEKEIPLNSPQFKKSMDARLIQGFSLAYYVQSRTSDVITYLYDRWYPLGRKIIDKGQIENFFTLESLAWWYMDDGHLNIKSNIPRKVILSCESFTVEENIYLQKFLCIKYNLEFARDKQNRLILYDQYQIIYFLSLLKPHLHHSMHRKQTHHSFYSQVTTGRRTTIYLPTPINIQKPTQDINHGFTKLSTIIKHFKDGGFYDTYSDSIDNMQKYKEQQSYQIIISQSNLSNLSFLKNNTGLTYSQLAYLCFHT